MANTATWADVLLWALRKSSMKFSNVQAAQHQSDGAATNAGIAIADNEPKQASTAKLACTAAGVGFEVWKHRPVYRVHCRTYAAAKELCNETVSNRASVLFSADENGLDTFRALAPFRTTQAKALRSRVAGHIRMNRAMRSPETT